MTIALLIVTVVFSSLLTAALAGTALFALAHRWDLPVSSAGALAVLMIFFAFDDVYYIPLVRLLDISFSVGNAEVAKFLHLAGSSSASDFFSVRLTDALIWLVQTAVGYAAGSKLIGRLSNA